MADTVSCRQYSGIGGHEDFIAPSGSSSRTARSSACRPRRPSTAVAISRLVAEPAPGTIVTTPRHQLDVVITEHGVAELRGKTVRERARALAAIAHPDFRDELQEAAAEQLG